MKSEEAKKKAEELGIDPQSADFTLSEQELEDVSGGTGASCSELGIMNPNCTQNGFSAGCTEIGCLNPDCTKLGME